MKIIFSPKCLEYNEPGHPESPDRVGKTYDFLKEKFEIVEPGSCSDEDILRVHTKELLEKVKSGDFFDADTPSLPGMYDYAKLSAGAAVKAAEIALRNESAFSLVRPPGHHAGKNFLGGFCYFNNIAIAVRYALVILGVDNVLILDIDCHHGNGTQDIFLGEANIQYVSLHQSPLYPGTGLKSEQNCRNYPVPAGTNEGQYISAFSEALKEARSFSPTLKTLVAVSAGFDTYEGDPIAGLALEKQTYRKIGEMIASLNLPTFAVLEGGYSQDMPYCVNEFLQGF